MRIEENYSLQNHNTFHLPVNARWFMEYENAEELERILKDEYFQECNSLHIGEGSNLLFLNDFDGIILHSAIKGIHILEETPEYIIIQVGAAEKWDDVVAYAVKNKWGGIENLSYIPGETGAAAIQNIGAYGAEIKDVIEYVETYNQLTQEKKIFSKEECRYGYRTSYFKDEHNEPHIVTHVQLRLDKQLQYKLEYGNLKTQLSQYSELSLSTIRDAVIAIRKEKLPEPDVLGNAGSFFTNPVITPEHFRAIKEKYPTLPSYSVDGSQVKIPAGWLIEQCGFKGKTHGEVGVYEKQALVLVNLGHATGNDIALVAESIRCAVKDTFGIELLPEVKYVV